MMNNYWKKIVILITKIIDKGMVNSTYRISKKIGIQK